MTTPYSQNIQTRVPTGGNASPIARTSACLPHHSHPYSSPIWTVQAAGERQWTGNTCWHISGVSHLLHARELNTLGTFLYKIRNVAGEVLHRLIDLNVVLPSGCRPDSIMVFLQPAQQPHP